MRVTGREMCVLKSLSRFWNVCGCQGFPGCEILTRDWNKFLFFLRPPEVVNFSLKSLLETTFAQSKQIWSFDDGDTHTRSIDLVGVESTHSAIEVEDLQMKPETPNASHATPHFLARNANAKPSSQTSRPLATSSLVVGHFAAKQGSLHSPRGRLVASLKFKRNAQICRWLIP